VSREFVSRLDPTQQAQAWGGWRQGKLFKRIALDLQVDSQQIYRLIRSRGGVAPQPRRRAPRQLTQADRETISRGLSAAVPIAQIAEQIGKARCTVDREIKRNGGANAYRAVAAEVRAWEQAQRPKQCALAKNEQLRDYVVQALCEHWSPQQISWRLEQQFSDDQSMRVSHETIYRSLFIQARGLFKQELTQHLRRGKSLRRAPASTRGHEPTRIAEGLSIRERPAEVEDRAVPGHWEGDLISGRANASHIATLVERHSRFVMLVKVPSKHAPEVARALAQKMCELPVQLRRSLTWDRGSEMASHKEFTLASDMQVYFCDPHSPWQRGANENTNGLLRQYFPKGTDLSVHSQAHLNAVAAQLNGRPRQTLNFRTPAEKLADTVAFTG
jgi:IS30 family transposase